MCYLSHCHTRCIYMLSSCSCNTGLTQSPVYSLRNIRAHAATLESPRPVEKQQPHNQSYLTSCGWSLCTVQCCEEKDTLQALSTLNVMACNNSLSPMTHTLSILPQRHHHDFDRRWLCQIWHNQWPAEASQRHPAGFYTTTPGLLTAWHMCAALAHAP